MKARSLLASGKYFWLNPVLLLLSCVPCPSSQTSQVSPLPPWPCPGVGGAKVENREWPHWGGRRDLLSSWPQAWWVLAAGWCWQQISHLAHTKQKGDVVSAVFKVWSCQETARTMGTMQIPKSVVAAGQVSFPSLCSAWLLVLSLQEDTSSTEWWISRAPV